MFKDRKRLLEWGKNVLIVVLVITALMLGSLTGVFGGLRRSDGLQDDAVLPESGGVAAAAMPFVMAVADGHVGRCGVTYGAERIEALYERFSAALGEALGSSGTPEEVTEQQWRAALGGPGVYFDYLYEQPLSVLSAWLGTEVTGGAGAHTARRICLALEGDGLALYYVRARSGGFYRCETALSASAVSARLQEYTSNGASFVWELTEDENLDPYALFEEGLQTLSHAEGTNPIRDTAVSGQLPELFGFAAARSYTEEDDTVYVEGDATLRVSSSGAVNYRCYEEGLELGGAYMSAQAVVEAARALCQRGPGASCGAAKLGLSDVRYDQNTNTYTVCFEYAVDGVPVRLPEGPAAELTVTDGRLQEAAIHFRSYALTTETTTPLPPALAMAAVRAAGGGEPLLAYVDSVSAVNLRWLAA